LPWSVVAPASFYQNDLRLRDLIVEQGIYPNPIGKGGINRVDVGDIAGVAAAALLDPGYESREVAAVGPDTWTGEAIAEVYSRVLGREVRYTGDDLEAWAAGARSFMPEWLVGDLVRMFAHFQDRGMAATEAQFADTRAALGREPRPFVEFASELVAGA
ncbi:MAG TPA: NmrA/HSCARG family protein, partial [Gemmatimonadota bacterium]|nr:NmrA/HSCARG family protein [Gemmatimonadota bacterium]